MYVVVVVTALFIYMYEGGVVVWNVIAQIPRLNLENGALTLLME